MLPIVFIHNGGDSYLGCSLTQARLSNPKSEVHLVGDRYNRGFAGVIHSDRQTYSERAERFAAIYQHRNTNPHGYELFCFQRWFILLEFLRQRNLESCLYLDSDVLLFADAEAESKRFAACDLTLSCISPHCVYVNRRSALESFCSFLEEAYTDPTLFHSLEAVYLESQARGLPGGVCDMTAFDYFRRNRHPNIRDISSVVDGTIYDNSMCGPAQGLEMRNGIKLIRWVNDLPHGRLTSSGEWIRLMALHFQGPSKGRIFDYVRCGSWKGNARYYWNRLQAKRGKYQQKFAKRFAAKPKPAQLLPQAS